MYLALKMFDVNISFICEDIKENVNIFFVAGRKMYFKCISNQDGNFVANCDIFQTIYFLQYIFLISLVLIVSENKYACYFKKLCLTLDNGMI